MTLNSWLIGTYPIKLFEYHFFIDLNWENNHFYLWMCNE